jgi:uncharacterized membrane protein YgdD (TMEM256/DUF423 family)
MTMDRLFFTVGAVLAFIGVAAGAFGAHGLEGRVPADRLATFETGVRYQMYHAFALMLIALAASRWAGSALQAAGWSFILGTVVFCGTLYALTLGGPRWLGAVTPIGGLAFLAGWALTVAAVLRAR